MADKDTTHTGVPSSDAGFIDESKDRPLTPREEALAAIKATRLERFNDELAEAGGERVVFSSDPNGPDPDDIENDPPAPTPKPKAAPAAETAAEQMARQMAPGTDPKSLVKVKVDGEEMEVPFETLVANFQKTSAADKRLRDATEEADRIRREAAQPAATPPAAPAAAPIDGKRFTEALFQGDEDGALSSLSELIADGVKKAVEALPKAAGKPTNDELAAIEEGVTQRIADRNALTQSQRDYPQLYADPDVQALGRMKIERRMAEGVPFVDALAAVGSEMAGTMGWKKPAGRPGAPAVDRGVLDKLGKKGSLDAIPTATARRSAPEEAEPILDENQRAARGIEFLRRSRPGQQAA